MFDLDDNDPLFQLGKGESEDPMPEPSALANEQKQTTLDIIVEDLTAKPVQMSMANASRSNTIAQLDIDLNNDEPLPEPDPANRVSTDDLLADPSEQFEIAV